MTCSALQALVESTVTVEVGGKSQLLARIVAAGGRFMMIDSRKGFLVSHSSLAESYAAAVDSPFPFSKAEVGALGLSGLQNKNAVVGCAAAVNKALAAECFGKYSIRSTVIAALHISQAVLFESDLGSPVLLCAVGSHVQDHPWAGHLQLPGPGTCVCAPPRRSG